MLSKLLLLSAATTVTVTTALELTPDNWDEKTAGKSVLIKFLAPWWGHCKSMKPAWDKLMDEFASSPTSLVADVDCTAAGQPLCEKHGVKGYPSIKYGEPSDLKDYNGGRDFDSLKKFAEENLGPQCGPGNLDLCTDDKTKAKYEKYMGMSLERLENKVRQNTVNYELENPVMKKVVGWKKSGGGDKKKGDEKKELWGDKSKS